jgi:hypothetical protein
MLHRESKNSPEKRPSIDVVSVEMEALRHYQASAIDALDAKAGVVLGFSGTVLTILAATTTGPDDPLWIFFDFLFLMAAVGCAIKALSPSEFRFDPKPRVLFDYMHKSPDAPGSAGAKEQILADKVAAYEANEKTLWNKGTYVYGAVAFLGLALTLVSVQTLVRRIVMNKKSESNETAPKTPGSTPPAEPNPAATNVIKKGLTDSNTEKR